MFTNHMKFNRNYVFGLLAILTIVLSGCVISVPPMAQMDGISPIEVSAAPALDSASEAEIEHIKFDVAENMAEFAYDQNIAFDDGLPSHGSTFITRGYIYEYGTLSDSNGVLPDGSPEFPNKVIGTWVCRGWFVGDAAHATEGPWVVTTQIYDLGGELGQSSIMSDGFELADLDKTIQRAVIGGTGEYAHASGQASQILLGFNQGEGVNLRFELDVMK